MNIDSLNGKQISMLFAAPCAAKKFDEGKISRQDCDTCMLHVTKQIQPRTALIRRCFPDFYADLRELARLFKMKMWDRQTILNFWFNHEGKSPVIFGAVFDNEMESVSKFPGKNRMVVTVSNDANGQTMRTLNARQIPLSNGDCVVVHNGWIILALAEVDYDAAPAKKERRCRK